MRAEILAYNSDLEIIRDYTMNRSNRAATAFVRKHQKFVYASALRYLQNHDDAEDAAQEVFIRSLKNLHKFRGDSNIKTWLYRITMNICNNMIRKKKLSSIFGSDDQRDYLNTADTGYKPDEEMENSQFREKFNEALAKLPEKQRETFALRYFEEMTYEEISDMLGTSVGGLKANYYQATKKLAKMLEDDRF